MTFNLPVYRWSAKRTEGSYVISIGWLPEVSHLLLDGRGSTGTAHFAHRCADTRTKVKNTTLKDTSQRYWTGTSQIWSEKPIISCVPKMCGLHKGKKGEPVWNVCGSWMYTVVAFCTTLSPLARPRPLAHPFCLSSDDASCLWRCIHSTIRAFVFGASRVALRFAGKPFAHNKQFSHRYKLNRKQ